MIKLNLIWSTANIRGKNGLSGCGQEEKISNILL